MTELSTKQKSFVKTMTEDEEYERRGFELLLRRQDFDSFFDALADAGLFDPSRNLGPVPADKPGTIDCHTGARLHISKLRRSAPVRMTMWRSPRR